MSHTRLFSADSLRARLKRASSDLVNTWAGPALLAAAFILTLGMLLGIIQYRTLREQQVSLTRDTQNAQRSLLARLDSNADFLTLLAEMQAEGTLDVATFEERVSPYVADHPEILYVAWSDNASVVRWISPFEPHKNLVGLPVSMPAPKAGYQTARDTRQPAYAGPFVTLQGVPAVQVYVPVYRNDEFLGAFSGTYSLEGLLQFGLPPSIRDRYHLSLVNADDTPLASIGATDHIDEGMTRSIVLTPPIEELSIRLTRYAAGWGWELWALTLLTIGLAVGMGASMWGLSRDSRIRRDMLATLAEREAQYRGVFEATSDGLIINDMNGVIVEANPAACEMHGYEYDEFIGMRPTEFIKPEYHDLFEEYVATIRAGKNFRAQAVDVRKDGTEFYVEVRGSPFHFRGTPHMLGVVRDVTERVMAERILERRVADRTRELSALYDVTTVARASLNLDTILERSLEHVLNVMNSSAGSVHLYSPTDETLHLATSQGLPPESLDIIRTLSPADSLAGLALQRNASVVVHDVSDNPKAKLAHLIPSTYAYLGAPMHARGEVVGVLSVLGAANRHFTVDEIALLEAIADQVGGAVENARLYSAETARREEAVRRREVAEGLRDIIALLNSNLDLNTILPQIVEQAVRLLGADAAAVFRLHANESVFRIEAAHALDDDYVAGIDIPEGHGTVGRAVTTQSAVAIPDVTALTPDQNGLRWPSEEHGGEKWEVSSYVLEQFRAILTVPLIINEEAYGGLSLYYHEPQTFSDESINLATAFADQVALAIENAHLRDQAEQLAVMNERSRLARELHDSVTQSLYSLTLFAEAGRRLAAGDEWERVADYVDRLGDTAQSALREMRLLVYELRPLVLEHEGLVGALRHRLEAVERRAGMQASLTVNGTPEVLPGALEVTLYRVTQEALNNALKHADATTVSVYIDVDEAGVTLDIADDGVGFEHEDMVSRGGIGLTSMQERVEALGGTLSIESEPGNGTRIHVDVPLTTHTQTEEPMGIYS